MTQPAPRSAAPGNAHDVPLPEPPFDVVVLGAGRVGGSIARAVERAGHAVLAEIRRGDDPSPVARASVVVIAVPDDALPQAAALVARLGHAGAVVLHTSGLAGLDVLSECGPRVAAVHPAVPVASPDARFTGAPFGVTCPEELRSWCASFVRDLGGEPVWIPAEARATYHAALVMASNFAVALAGDAAELLGGHALLVPLLRATLDNVERLGPDLALTGPVVRGDAGTVRAHLRALPAELRDAYVAMSRRALARALAAERLDDDGARRVRDVLDEAGP